MRRWLRQMRCRLSGHDTRAFRTYGGLPGHTYFGIEADCRRCGVDLSVEIPSSFTIYRRDPDHG